MPRRCSTWPQDDDKVEQYGQELDGFVRLLGELPDLANAMQNPLYTEAARKAVFHSIAEKVDLSPILTSFINLLIEKKRVQNLPEIAEYYHRLIDDYSNIARAQIRAAIELNEEVVQESPGLWKRSTENMSSSISAGPFP